MDETQAETASEDGAGSPSSGDEDVRLGEASGPAMARRRRVLVTTLFLLSLALFGSARHFRELSKDAAQFQAYCHFLLDSAGKDLPGDRPAEVATAELEAVRSEALRKLAPVEIYRQAAEARHDVFFVTAVSFLVLTFLVVLFGLVHGSGSPGVKPGPRRFKRLLVVFALMVIAIVAMLSERSRPLRPEPPPNTDFFVRMAGTR